MHVRRQIRSHAQKHFLKLTKQGDYIPPPRPKRKGASAAAAQSPAGTLVAEGRRQTLSDHEGGAGRGANRSPLPPCILPTPRPTCLGFASLLSRLLPQAYLARWLRNRLRRLWQELCPR